MDAVLPCHSEHFNAAVIAALPDRLQVIANHSVGVDHVDLGAAAARGIIVTNTPDVLSDATAEIAILCMLGAARRGAEGDRMVREDRWNSWSPSFMVGKQITGKRFGVMGMGRVGLVTAARARGFGMEIHYHNRRPLTDAQAVGAIYHDTPESLIAQSDVLSLHCPASPETTGLMNAARIELMPMGAILVNTARGALVDDYVWTQLFAETFNPLEEENWRLLLLQPVVDHITKVFAVGLLESQEMHTTGHTEIRLRHLSEVPKLMVRESASVEVSKCIYNRLGWPSRNGGLEKAFIHWAQADTQVLAFCKISENRHTFARLRYVKDDGLPAFLFTRLSGAHGGRCLLGRNQRPRTNDPSQRAAKTQSLAGLVRAHQQPDRRPTRRPPWHYVLLGESVVYEWQGKGARMAELLDYAKLRPLNEASL